MDPENVIRLIISLLLAIFGACLGSFLYCWAWRRERGESIVRGRSHCDHCGHVLGVLDLFPVFSYVFSGGKCRYCHEKIPVRTLLVELVSAAALVCIFLKYGFSVETPEYLLFTGMLLALSFTDIESFIIPDGFLIFGIVVRVIFLFFAEDLKAALITSLIGGFACALVLLLVVLAAEKIMQKEAMGGGDIKLIFVTGLYLGWKGNVVCILAACFLGIIIGVIQMKKNDGESKPFPFGPSIAAGAWFSCLFGAELINWYIGLF